MTAEVRDWIGSSDIAAIMGISPFPNATPLQTYLRITGQAPELTKEKLDFFAGRKSLELFIAEKLRAKYGVMVREQNVRYDDPEYPFIRAEIDAETETDNYEFKSVHPMGWRSFGQDGSDDFPMYIAAQVQYGLMVRPKQRAFAMASIGFDEQRRYPVEPDYELQKVLRQAAVDFWNKHIIPMSAPEPRTKADVELLYPKHSAEVVVATEADIENLRLHQQLGVEIKALEKTRENLGTVIKARFGAAGTMVRDGAGVAATWTNNKDSQVFDAERFERENPQMWRDYLKSKPGPRVLRNKI